MKRILIFSLAYFPHIGGAEIAIKEITDRISSDEVSFDMVTLRFEKSSLAFEKIGNVNVYRIGSSGSRIQKLFFPLAAFIKARSLHRHSHYDVIWSIMANYAGFAALFFKYHFLRVPFLLTLQEGDPIPEIKHKVRFVYPLFRRIFSRADYIQTISNYLADWARQMGAVSQITVVPNGVNVRVFNDKDLVSIDELRKNLGYKQNDVLLITTSRLVDKNAVEDIIESLKFLPESVKLLILGTGPLGGRLKLRVESLKLEERIKLIGYVSHENLPLYLWTSDIFTRPSLSEGMGNSFIEAMAAGLPVIATPVGGIVDFLKDGETGLFCEVHNPKSIAEKVQILISDRNLRDRIVSNAKVLVATSYDWKGISERMKKIFESM